MIRILILRLLTYVTLFALLVALFIVQIHEGDYYRRLGDRNRMRLIPLEAPRGRVLDRHGKLLATNRPSYDLIISPEDTNDRALSALSEITGIDVEIIRKRLKAPREYPFSPSVIQEDIGQKMAFQIEERLAELAGVSVQVSGRRYYPYKDVGAHLIGYIGKLNRSEYLKFKSDKSRYGYNSYIGRRGFEKLFDYDLRGVRGGRQIEVNAAGRLVQVLSEKDPEPGKDIHLTIDLELQKKIAEILGDKPGSVAILDMANDELLAMVSNPSFDPNAFVTPGQDQLRLEFLRSKNAPMFDRTVSGAYPPGSVFKVVTALAGLETGKITANTHVDSPSSYRLTPNGRAFKCWYKPGHGSINVETALERSANVFFYKLGRKLGPDRIASYARKFGFGEKVDIPVLNQSAGLVPDSEWKKERYGEKWYEGESLSYAIGQGYLLVSPIQMLRMVASVANGGKLVHPSLIKDASNKQKEINLGFKKQNIQTVQRGMQKVVESNYGTGQLARVDFGEMAAKTGTAQAPPKESHAWMAGYFPYKKPEIAFVAFLEHGGSGGMDASQIILNVVKAWRDLYGPKVA